MEISLWFVFFHLIGFGLLVMLLVTGWVFHLQYKKSPDYQTKLVVLSSARTIGLMSPFIILLVLLTGLGNMYVRGLGFMTEAWLAVKIVLFVIAAANGIAFGIRSKKRGTLVAQIVKGSASTENEKTLAAMESGALMFNLMLFKQYY